MLFNLMGWVHKCTDARMYTHMHTGMCTCMYTSMHTGKLYTVGFRSAVSYSSYTYAIDMGNSLSSDPQTNLAHGKKRITLILALQYFLLVSCMTIIPLKDKKVLLHIYIHVPLSVLP